MTVIKLLVFIIAHGAIEPRIFVACFSIVFPRAVSSFHPVTVRLVFLHCMGSVRIIRSYEKWSWQIRRSVQSNNIFSKAIEMVDGSISGV